MSTSIRASTAVDRACGFRADGRRLPALWHPDDEWMDSTEAAAKLGCIPGNIFHLFSIDGATDVVRRKSRSKNGGKAQAVGWLYWREDIHALRRVARECRLQPAPAMRVLVALRKGKIVATAD